MGIFTKSQDITETVHRTPIYDEVIKLRRILIEEICKNTDITDQKKIDALLKTGTRPYLNSILNQIHNPTPALQSMIALCNDVTDSIIERNQKTLENKEVINISHGILHDCTTSKYDVNKQFEIDKKMADTCISSIKENKNGFSSNVGLLQKISDFLQNIAAAISLCKPAPDRRSEIEKSVEDQSTVIKNKLR